MNTKRGREAIHSYMGDIALRTVNKIGCGCLETRSEVDTCFIPAGADRREMLRFGNNSQIIFVMQIIQEKGFLSLC